MSTVILSRKGFLAIATLVGLFACGTSSADEPVGSSAAPLSGYGATTVPAAATFGMQEPSAAYISPRTLIVGFNINTADGQGWATFTDTGSGLTLINACGFGNAGTPTAPSTFFGTCPAAPVPFPTLAAGVGHDFIGWAGDPTIRSDGMGNAVFVSLAGATGDPGGAASWVTATVSTNGGVSFGGSTTVNTQQGDFNCDVGLQDQPDATFDYSTSPPTLWVVYRHRDNGAATWGGCFRRGIIDTTAATIHWLDPHAFQISGFGGPPHIFTQGGLRISAGDGAATVIFSTNANPPQFCSGPLPNQIDEVHSVVTFDNGQNWVDNVEIVGTNQEDECTLASGSVANGFRIFDVTRTPQGLTYVVVGETKDTARLFMSSASGIKGWENSFSTINTWFEYCVPEVATSTLATGPTSIWKRADTGACPTPAFRVPGSTPASQLSMLFPSIASDGRGQLVVTFYGSLPASGSTPADTAWSLFASSNLVPETPITVTGFGAPIALTSFANPPNFTSGFPRPLGDYMVVTSSASPASARGFRPGCTEHTHFVAAWTQSVITTPSSGAMDVRIGLAGVNP